MQEQKFSTGIVDINYAVGPASGPPLILLHGVTARWQSFMTLIPYLTPYWQVYALDFRGHGRSGHTPNQYRVEDYTIDLLSFLRKRLTAPAMIFGHSLGGRVALNLARAAPELVKAIVVGDTPLTALGAQGGSNGSFLKTFGRWHSLMETEHTLFSLARALGEIAARPGADGKPRQFKDFWDQSELLFQARCLQMVDADVLEQMSGGYSAAEYNILGRLGQIACPVMFLQGNPDFGALLSDDDLAVALSQMPQAAAVTIEGAGHGLHRDQPAAVIRAIHSFLCSM